MFYFKKHTTGSWHIDLGNLFVYGDLQKGSHLYFLLYISVHFYSWQNDTIIWTKNCI